MDDTKSDKPVRGFVKGHTPRGDPDKLSHNHVHALLEAARVNHADFIALGLLYYTALRASNVADLTRSNIDREDWVIFIPGEHSKTGRDIRTVVPRQFRAQLNTYLERPDIGENLFRHTRFSLWRACKKYAGAAGITKCVYPHMLRASMAVALLKQRNVKVAALHLGHSDERTTLRHYAPLDLSDMQEALENIDL